MVGLGVGTGVAACVGDCVGSGVIIAKDTVGEAVGVVGNGKGGRLIVLMGAGGVIGAATGAGGLGVTTDGASQTLQVSGHCMYGNVPSTQSKSCMLFRRLSHPQSRMAPWTSNFALESSVQLSTHLPHVSSQTSYAPEESDG
jgi:hypothetical protein